MGALSELRGKTRTKVYEDTIGIKFHYTVRNENRIQINLSSLKKSPYSMFRNKGFEHMRINLVILKFLLYL